MPSVTPDRLQVNSFVKFTVPTSDHTQSISINGIPSFFISDWTAVVSVRT